MMGTKKTKKLDKAGFSLLEVLIAISVLSVGILALASMNIASLRGTKISKELTYATLEGQALLEEHVFSRDFEDLDTVCNNIPSTLNYAGISFSVQCRLITHSDELKQVIITLFWGSKRLQYTIFRARGDTL